MPSTAFMGVRISWLMLARKRDLAKGGRFGGLLAATVAASACLRAVMS